MIKQKTESFALFYSKYLELIDLRCENKLINSKKKEFKVTIKIKPTINSSEYLVEIYYVCNKFPKVYVYGLFSKYGDIKKIPHTFAVNREKDIVELCLYRQKYSEFNKKVLFSKNIIPWTCSWLHFFELYLITGNWYGNGEHPDNRDMVKKYAKI